MAVQTNNQRHIIGLDKLNTVLIGNMLFPERREMHFHGVEEVTPLIWFIGGDAVASNGARQHKNGIALRCERQHRRGNGRAGRWHALILIKIIEVVFNALTLFIGQFSGGCPRKLMEPRQVKTFCPFTQKPTGQHGADQYRYGKDHQCAHAFPIILILEVSSLPAFRINHWHVLRIHKMSL